jgi:hypothetical protein
MNLEANSFQVNPQEELTNILQKLGERHGLPGQLTIVVVPEYILDLTKETCEQYFPYDSSECFQAPSLACNLKVSKVSMSPLMVVYK